MFDDVDVEKPQSPTAAASRHIDTTDWFPGQSYCPRLPISLQEKTAGEGEEDGEDVEGDMEKMIKEEECEFIVSPQEVVAKPRCRVRAPALTPSQQHLLFLLLLRW